MDRFRTTGGDTTNPTECQSNGQSSADRLTEPELDTDNKSGGYSKLVTRHSSELAKSCDYAYSREETRESKRGTGEGRNPPRSLSTSSVHCDTHPCSPPVRSSPVFTQPPVLNHTSSHNHNQNEINKTTLSNHCGKHNHECITTCGCTHFDTSPNDSEPHNHSNQEPSEECKVGELNQSVADCPADSGAGRHSNNIGEYCHHSNHSVHEDGNNNNNTNGSISDNTPVENIKNRETDLTRENFEQCSDLKTFETETINNQRADHSIDSSPSGRSTDRESKNIAAEEERCDTKVSHRESKSNEVESSPGVGFGSFAGLGSTATPAGYPWLAGSETTLARYTCQVCGLVLANLGELGLHVQEHQTQKLYKCELCSACFETHLSLECHKSEAHSLRLAKHVAPPHGSTATTMQQQQQQQQHSDDTGGRTSVASNTQSPSPSLSGRDYEDKARFSFHTPWQEFDSSKREIKKENTSEPNLKSQNNNYVSAGSDLSRFGFTLPITSQHAWRASSASPFMTSSQIPGLLSPGAAQHVRNHFSYYSNGHSSREHSLERSRHLSTDSYEHSKRSESTPPTTSRLRSYSQQEDSQRLHSPVYKNFTGATASTADRPSSRNGDSKEEPHLGTVKTEQPSSSAYGSGAASSEREDALNNLKSLTANSFAYPSLPGFANAFGTHPWAANVNKYAAVNGYVQRIVGEPMLYSRGAAHALARPGRGSVGGKQGDCGLACEYCGKVCPRPSILKRHMMMHTGERPFECKVCGQRFRAKGSMLFHQKLRHNMDVKLNKALEERYLQIVANQRQKQMREERKKAALNSKDSAAWFQQEVQTWMLQNHLHNQAFSGAVTTTASAAVPIATTNSFSNRIPSPAVSKPVSESDSVDYENSNFSSIAAGEYSSSAAYPGSDHTKTNLSNAGAETSNHTNKNGEHSSSSRMEHEITDSVRTRENKSSDSVFKDENANSELSSGDVNGNVESYVRGQRFKHKHSDADKHMDEQGERNSSTETAETVDSPGKMAPEHAQNLNRMRELMFTPEPALEAFANFDDNCNLKENLDRMIMNAFSKLGIDNYCMAASLSAGLHSTPVDGNGREGDQSTSANSSISISPVGQGTRPNNRSQDRDGDQQLHVEYPAVFPGLKQHLSIRNETVIISRLDGVNQQTGDKVSLYKCYLCGRIFHQLSVLQLHLSTHFEKRVTYYQCLYCDACYRFKTQLVQHLQTHHRVQLSLEDGQIPQIPAASEMVVLTDAAESMNQDASSPSPLQPTTSDQTHKGKHYSGVSVRREGGLYVCRYCNKGFDRSFSVIRHERMHTGYKPCLCRYCGRGFSEPRNLRQHIARFHSSARGIMGKSLKHRRHNSCPGSVQREMRAKGDADVTNVFTTSQATFVHDGNKEAQSTQSRPDTSSPSLEQTVEINHEQQRESPDSHGNQSANSETSESKLDSSAEIANEIREKERLDDDVMVVIPSDAPLDPRQPALDTPRSVVSDNTTWSNVSEGDYESMGGEIMSAPVRSIIGSHQFKQRGRRPSVPGRSSTPTQGSVSPVSTPSEYRDGAGEYRESGGEYRDNTPSEELHARARSAASETDEQKPVFAPPDTSTSMTQAITPQGAAPAGLAQFAPLNVSTFLTPGGLPGILPSPLMSPAQAAFFAQAGLTSPTMLGGALPFMTSFAGSSSLGGASASAASSKEIPNCVAQSVSDNREALGYKQTSEAAKAEERREDYLSQLAKGTSLSRTHSRNPIKREEACKPTVLADGRTVYRCTYCNKDFATYSDINRHMDFHEDIRPYKCKFCDYYARTNSQLKVHMMRHQGIREFHCKLCNYKGVTQSDLNRHMKSQIHMMKAQNECRHCGEGFVSPKNLERHIEERHMGGTSARIGTGSMSSAGQSNTPIPFQAPPLPR